MFGTRYERSFVRAMRPARGGRIRSLADARYRQPATRSN